MAGPPAHTIRGIHSENRLLARWEFRNTSWCIAVADQPTETRTIRCLICDTEQIALSAGTDTFTNCSKCGVPLKAVGVVVPHATQAKLESAQHPSSQVTNARFGYFMLGLLVGGAGVWVALSRMNTQRSGIGATPPVSVSPSKPSDQSDSVRIRSAPIVLIDSEKELEQLRDREKKAAAIRSQIAGYFDDDIQLKVKIDMLEIKLASRDSMEFEYQLSKGDRDPAEGRRVYEARLAAQTAEREGMRKELADLRNRQSERQAEVRKLRMELSALE